MPSESNTDTFDAGILGPGDPIFESEQKHLSKVYSTLKDMAEEIELRMQRTREEATEAKRKMGEEISGDYTGFDETLETYADVEAANRIIAAYNISQESDFEKLTKINVLLKQPYFAKVVLKYETMSEPKEIYIGNAGMTDNDYRYLVIDWRSPVAEVYYNRDYGPTSYEANGRIINAELLLRRQFDIERDQLKCCFDTSVALQDPLLVQSLSRARSSRLRDITATIQREQNAVVRHEDVPVLLVGGIAGSGKTSVLLQRIAYLLYLRRDELDPDNVCLITPNPVFLSYIENVLPDLGERNPRIFTWEDFASNLVPKTRPHGGYGASMEVLSKINSLLSSYRFDSKDFNDVEYNGVKLITAGRIANLAERYAAKIPMGSHLITLIRETLLERLESRFNQLANSEAVLDEICDLTFAQQLEIFKEAIDTRDDEALPRLAAKYVQYKFGEAVQAVENDEWLRIDRIGMRMLGVEGLTTVEWLYLKIRLTGMGEPKVKYAIIDEVQDYSQGQLALLSYYFPNAHFLLLGDENQAIKPGTASFDQIEELFEVSRGKLSRCDLTTSYRSTPAITKLFVSLMAPAEGVEVSSVQRDDEAPRLIACVDAAEHAACLRKVVAEQAAKRGLCAIVVTGSKQAKQVAEILKPDSPEILSFNDRLPEQGILIVELSLAKGLEFDHVIVPDVSRRSFNEDDLSRRRLYTTVSRATRTVTMLSLGKPTSLLNSYLEA